MDGQKLQKDPQLVIRTTKKNNPSVQKIKQNQIYNPSFHETYD